MQEYCFVGCSDNTEISEVMASILTECPTCFSRMEYFCLEKSCEKSAPFCLKCQGHIHILHRINQVKMIFVDRNIVKSTHTQAVKYLEQVISMLVYQKNKADVAAVESIQISNKIQELLKVLTAKKQQLITDASLSKLYELVNTVLTTNRQKLANIYEIQPNSTLNPEVSKTDSRKIFQDLFTRIDFSEQFKFQEMDGFKQVMEGLQRYNNQIMNINSGFTPYSFQLQRESQIDSFLKLRKSYFGQDLFTMLRQTHLSNYLGANWNLMVPISQSYHRSIIVNMWQRRNFVARRVFLKCIDDQNHECHLSGARGDQTEKNWKVVRELLQRNITISQLCTYRHSLTQYPRNLKSLSCYISKEQMHKLPISLRSLRVLVKSAPPVRNRPFQRNFMRRIVINDIRNNDDYILLNDSSIQYDDPQEFSDAYDLRHLAKLRYLVVRDLDITPAQIKKIIRFSIQNKLQMLVLLDSRGAVRNKIRIQDSQSHMYPQLQWAYNNYIRRLCQATVLCRTRFLSKSRFRQQILQTAVPWDGQMYSFKKDNRGNQSEASLD